MTSLHLFQSDTKPTITTTELLGRLSDPDLTVVDLRPPAAYNGWRLRGEARGGHIPGAVSFPAPWLETVDEPEIVATPIVAGSESFLSWIEEETRTP